LLKRSPTASILSESIGNGILPAIGADVDDTVFFLNMDCWQPLEGEGETRAP
jgi:hypothetical protein